MAEKKHFLQNPTTILRAAVEELDLFTKPDASRLEIGEDGRIKAASSTGLDKVVSLAKSYVGPFLSDQVRQEQEKKLHRLKQAILRARDIVKSHSALIEEGGDSQLADYALKTIRRYNAIVAHASSNISQYDIYNYERNKLLSDQEIKGQQIELPPAVSVKYDSHPDHPARKMLRELSETLIEGASKKNLSPTHKKTAQFMTDTFRLKALRMIQEHLAQQSSMAEILQLIKQKAIEIDDESDSNLIIMRQLLEVGPGAFILLTGCFKRHVSDAKFMTMPILESFRLSSQLSHSGFPYPSQHAGWALADKCVEASPLRLDQVPLFQQIDQRKKRLVQNLLFDQTCIQQARKQVRLKRDVFDENRALFIPLHYQMQCLLIRGMEKQVDLTILDSFYKEVENSSSAYDLLVHTQQQIIDLFIKKPLKSLEDEWLGMESTPLRTGKPQEKFLIASKKLEEKLDEVQEKLDPSQIRQAYIIQQGRLLGEAFQAIGLQYQSEKMGFAPPLLNDFERKLQFCAFDQLLSFINECEWKDNVEIERPSEHCKKRLLMNWNRDLQLFQSPTVDEMEGLPLSLINELEVYFNSRFYQSLN